MQLLGTIGIDPTLLVAQIVNFILLMWILNKFLYKPIVKKIEENEKKLTQAKEIQENMKKEQDLFEQKKKEDMQLTHDRIVQIIKEAEDIASQIKKKQIDEYDKNKLQFLKQTDILLESKQKQLQKDISAQMKATLEQKYLTKIKMVLTDVIQKELDLFFFDHLLERLHKTPINMTTDNTSAILKKLENLSHDLSPSESKALGHRLSKNLIETVGALQLTYVNPLSADQKKRLISDLSHKLELEASLLDLNLKKDENLLSGYQLEVGGLIIASNLRTELIND